MFKIILVLFNAAALLLAATAPAHAGPVAAGIAAIMASPFGQLIAGIGLSLVSNVVKGLFGSKQAQKVSGTQLTKRFGGSGPFSFPLGPAGSAGTCFYFGSWGENDQAPNAFYVEAIAVSDLPISGYPGWWVNDQRAEFGTYNATLGFPVLDFRRNGVDHVWIKPYTGTQIAPDAYLRSKFGDDPVYPYDADMVGRGVAYFIVTTRRPGAKDQDLLSAPAKVLAELGSILQYDIRKDSTAGGSGLHRWGQYATYEPSSNLMVQAYNVARGISYDGQWVFGGQNWPAFRLPASSWMAAMNACDLAIPLKGGGAEPQFHGGGMVEVSQDDPASVINEHLKSANAKIAETGGVYKVRVGAPGIPVLAFTDADIVVTREHGWTPFRGLGETFNTVDWTYSEPRERWVNKPGPQYKEAALVAADRARTLPTDISLPWTQSNTTGQRLVQAALKNSRRFDTHVFYMPPIAWLLEALDTVSWSSVQAGYDNKEFEIDEASGGSDLIQTISIRECDPSDYNWSPTGDQRAYAISPLVTIRPAPQPVSGPSVAPVPGELAYDVFWSAPSVAVDVDFVRVSHYEPGATKARHTVPIPKPNLLTGEARIATALKPNETVEVQIEYIALSGRAMVASARMPVTIADVRTGPQDLTDELNTARALAARTIEEMQADRSRSIARFADGIIGQTVEMHTMRTEITARFQTTEASYMHEVNVIAGAMGLLVDRTELLEGEVRDPASGLLATAMALDSLRIQVSADLEATADMINALEVKAGEATAGFLLAARVVAGPSGAEGAIQLGLRTTEGGTVTWTGIMIVRIGGVGRIYLDADETVVTGKMRDVAGRGYIDFTTGEQRWESA